MATIVNKQLWERNISTCCGFSPDSHSLEHFCVGVEWKHCGAANTRTVQQAQRQALHEGQRRGFGSAIVYGPRNGRLGQDGVYAYYMAMLQLQHSRQEGFCSLRWEKKKKGEWRGK